MQNCFSYGCCIVDCCTVVVVVRTGYTLSETTKAAADEWATSKMKI